MSEFIVGNLEAGAFVPNITGDFIYIPGDTAPNYDKTILVYCMSTDTYYTQRWSLGSKFHSTNPTLQDTYTVKLAMLKAALNDAETLTDETELWAYYIKNLVGLPLQLIFPNRYKSVLYTIQGNDKSRWIELRCGNEICRVKSVPQFCALISEVDRVTNALIERGFTFQDNLYTYNSALLDASISFNDVKFMDNKCCTTWRLEFKNGPGHNVAIREDQHLSLVPDAMDLWSISHGFAEGNIIRPSIKGSLIIFTINKRRRYGLVVDPGKQRVFRVSRGKRHFSRISHDLPFLPEELKFMIQLADRHTERLGRYGRQTAEISRRT